jgi:hypothetical protein
MLNWCRFLKQTAGFAVAGLAIPEAIRAADIPGIQAASMRGSINTTDLGARPGALDDQSRVFSAMLERPEIRICRYSCRPVPTSSPI